MRGEFVDVGGTRLYYYAAGSRGGGDPVVFIHGFPGSTHGWRLLAPLMPAGRRLVVMDLAGCGRSDGAGPDGAGIATHARLVRGLMDDLSIARAAIVAHGIGGAIAQWLAIEHADRVSALALLGSVALGVWPRSLGRMARVASPAATLIGAPMLASFLHGSALRGYADRDAGRRALDQSLNAYRNRLGAESIVAHLRLPRDPAIAAIGARLGEIRVPTAVIWGEADPFLPVALGERLSAAIPGATLHVIPGARHFVAEEAAGRCAEVVGAMLTAS